MSRCFTSGTPNLSASNYIYNKKCKVMYENIVDTNLNGDCVTWDGKTGADCSGYLLHTDSAETHLALKYGAALCNPCDISGLVTDPGDPSGIFDKCLCRVPFPRPMFNVLINLILDASVSPAPALDTIIEDMVRVGLGPDYLLLPWHILQSPDSWNANNIAYSIEIEGKTHETTPTVSICIPDCADNSGCICCPVNSGNVLCCTECNFAKQTDLSGFQYFDSPPALPCIADSSGGSQLPGIYGAYLCVDNNANIFNEPCDAKYYPEGTFAFTLQEAIGAWLYLWEPIVHRNHDSGTGYILVTAFKQAGFVAIRPRTTVSNYLSRFKKKFRFFRPEPYR